MKNKRILILFMLIYLLQIIALVLFSTHTPEYKPDTVAVNDLCQSVSAAWPDFSTVEHYDSLNYVIIDQEEHVCYRSRNGLSESINAAINHGDLMIDITSENQVVGKLIIFHDQTELYLRQKQTLITGLIILLVIQCLLGLGIFIYFEYVVQRPFEKLRSFAIRVSQGNLDLPLEMDRKNIFGAFTESFDIMRTELKKARLAETQAKAEKKELIAKLSHDIKTPVASIKAASEVGLAIAQEEKSKERFSQIMQKADQINTLTTNLFSAALEDLRQLNVNPADLDSREILTLLKNSDYMNRAEFCTIPPCIVYADKLRLQQVFDNIFANSYKYADTPIHISSGTHDKGIYICIEDEGGGVPPEELPLLTQKFRRGANASDKEGAGLGLYISSYFMQKMQGNLFLENGEKGLKTTVFLSLSGIPS